MIDSYAMGLVTQREQAHRRGSARIRRTNDQAFFEAIYINADGVVSATLTGAFRVLPRSVRASIAEINNPGTDLGSQGSSSDDPVGVTGLEPVTSAV